MKTLKFKPELSVLDLHRMKPSILMIMLEFFEWCCENDLPCLITSLMENAVGRKSLTHAEGRSFDASIRGFERSDIDSVLDLFNGKYARSLGTAPKGKPPLVVICHSAWDDDGNKLPNHLHFQIRRGK